MEKQFSYRITKIAGRAVAVAMCALTGMAVMGGAQAADVNLGTSFGTNSTPNDGATSTIGYFSDGYDRWSFSNVTSQQDVNGYAYNYLGFNYDVDGSRWRIASNPNSGYSSSSSRAGDLFYGGVVTYWRNDVASLNNSYVQVSSASNLSISVDAIRDYQYRANTFGAVIDVVSSNTYNFGVGSTVSSTLRGSKAFAYVSDFTPDYDVNVTGTARFDFNAGTQASQNSTGRAIDIAGTAVLFGGNTITGEALAQSFTVDGNNSVFNGAVSVTNILDSNATVSVNGNGNTFNGRVWANAINLTGDATTFAGNIDTRNGLNFLNGVTASMTNGASITGNVNFGNSDATLSLSDTSEINGAVTMTGVSGTLIFEGDGVVRGAIGSTLGGASLKEIRLNDTATVDLTHSAQAAVVNHVNYQAAALLTARGGLALDQGATDNQVSFGQYEGTLQVARDLKGIEGRDVVTTTGNNIGTVTMVGGTQIVTGNIGSAGHAIRTLNIGGTSTSGFDSDTESNTQVFGDVYAQNIVLQNTGSNSSVLLMHADYNLTGDVTTTDDGKGVLMMFGGDQTVTGQIGSESHELSAVAAGVDGANTRLNGDIYATQLRVLGTGLVNLNGNFIGTSLHYQDTEGSGEVKLAAGHDIHAAVTTEGASNGTLTLMGDTQTVTGQIGTNDNRLATVNAGQDGASSNFNSAVFATQLNVAGTGTVNLARDFTGDSIHYQAAGTTGTVNLAAGFNINAAVTTAGASNGILNLLGGIQTVTGQVGEEENRLATVNAGQNAAISNFSSDVFATQLNVTGTGTVNLNGDFTGTSVHYQAAGATGTVNLAAGQDIHAAVTTAGVSSGTLNLLGDTQTVTGQVGTSANRLATVNAGQNAATSNFSSDVFATQLNVTGTGTVNLNGDFTGTSVRYQAAGATGTVNLAVGQDINAAVTTAGVSNGILSLLGNTQTVTGQVGTSANRLATVNAGQNAATSNFNSDVFATQLNVTGTGTVNLNGDFTGTTLRYQATLGSGEVRLAAGQDIQAAVSTAGVSNGTLSLLGGTQTVTGQVGANANRLATVNAGQNAAISNFSSDVYATQLNVAGTGIVNLAGHFTGTSIHYQAAADGTVNMASGKNITGNVTTANTGKGVLTMQGGTQSVSGTVGASNAGLARINAGISGVTTLQGMVYADTLNYIGAGAGTVVLNGVNGGNGAVSGLVGTVDFNSLEGTLQIGDAVNLTTGAEGIRFADANNARMDFNGNSTVTGDLGAAATGSSLDNSTLKSIYAGQTGKAVTFKNDVHVSNNTFHVSGLGVVNLQGDLYGPLVYDADGTVNVSNGKSIRDDSTAAIGRVTTNVNNTGTLNYLGNTTLSNDLGTTDKALKAVNFHSDTSVAAVSQTINKNVYATQTTIGNGTTATTANITANVFLGKSLALAASNVTLNTANQDVAQVTAGARISGANANTLTFANTTLADGRLSTTATVTNATTGSGAITTNNATLNFSVAALPWAANAGGALNTEAASSLTGGTGSTLVMSGSEKVNVALLGSLKDNQSHTLIGVEAGTGAQIGTATDNSYVIDSDLSRNITGDLVVTFNRDSNSYITKSATAGHSSNGAAARMGTLGALGASYNADMQLVLNKLDLDQWGYGNNQANLATQVKRLAPIANDSAAQAALASTTSVLSSVSERLSVLRGDVAMVGLDGNGRQMGSDKTGWVKVLGSSSSAKAIDQFDGYKVTNTGLVAGADAKVRDGVLGASFSYVTSNISQQDFRLGDSGKMTSGTFAVYGTQEYGDVFLDGAVAFSQHNLEAKRAAALDRLAQADVDMNQTTLKLSAGYRLGINGSKVNVLTPMLSVEAASLKQTAYTETGADALSLNVDSKTVSRTRTSLGLRFNSIVEGANTTFYPELMVALNRNNGMKNTDVVANYMGDSSADKSFTTVGVSLPKSSYTLGAGVRFATSKSSEVQIGYRYEGGNGLSSRSAQLRGAWSF